MSIDLTGPINQILLRYTDVNTCQAIQNELVILLSAYEISPVKTELVIYDGSQDQDMLKMFYVSKRVSGLSEKTLRAYLQSIRAFMTRMSKPLAQIETRDIRLYLAEKEFRDGCSKTTINNIKRNLSSFFAWLEQENYIPKNPVLAIGTIKEPKRIKNPFSALEVEKLRSALETDQESALFETLLSTGMRISEILSVNIEAIDFGNGEIQVIGKGNKERTVYLNAKATLAIQKYLQADGRTSGPLFVGRSSRMASSTAQKIISNLGIRANVKNCHPHRFRRTMASHALNRGMPIDQVSKLLGHERIETTTRYAITDRDSLKGAHRKYVN